CHWCHVMAHESFEDPAVAAAMNERYVNIKVDREERPDLDQIYQTAHALLTRRSGGWPLTVFLKPAGAPYYAGTYFPKEGRYGLPGFIDILPRIAQAYRQQGEAIAEQSQRLADAMKSLEPAEPQRTSLPARAPGVALAELKATFDPMHGGFGAAPKFPHAAELEFCLRAFAMASDKEALTVVRTSLARMAEGGINDHLGGGFCRYSVDAEWTIPHFEKMLYDNGPLLGLYADLARATGEAAFGDVARNIVGWLVREMRAPDGAFYASLDADSEGEEGKFYVFTPDQVRAVLNDAEWAMAAPYFGLDGPPNFEHRHWNLRVVTPLAQVASKLGITLPDAQTRLVGAKAALFMTRAHRIRPGTDDKVLTAWNDRQLGLRRVEVVAGADRGGAAGHDQLESGANGGLAGLARASRAQGEPRWADLAFAAIDAIRATLFRGGRLFATRRAGAPDLPGYLDDHAFMLAALIEAMQTRFRPDDWDFARAIADALIAHFEDRQRGGFWFTSHDHEKLFHRTKPGRDNATPSGNGVAAQALIALGHLATEQRYLDAAARAVRVFASALEQSPGGHSTLLSALEDLEVPPTFVVLAGDPVETGAWHAALERSYRPNVRVVDLGPVDRPPPSLVKGRKPERGAVAWVCRGTTCLPPVASLADVEAALAQGR
ncbi:MAG: thioredoxin domain-containing protein, partial [Casimicrobiaceae bacterium]